MTEEHDIEEIVERLAKIADHILDSRRAEGYFYAGHIEALIADWRVKKAEIERLEGQLIAIYAPPLNPPSPPQSTAYPAD